MDPGQPSETAAQIAVQRVAAAADPFLRRLLSRPDEPYSAWFAEEHSPEARAQLAEWRSAETGPGHRRLADVLDPGGTRALLARKRFVEDEVRQALAEGLAQVVVLGAGYDPLCLLLQPEFPHALFFELDHPATQDVKRRALLARQALPAEVSLLPIDLATTTPAAALRATPAFSPEAPVVFVAEGLLMYLSAREVDGLLASVVGLAATGSRFVLTLLDRRTARDPRQGIRSAAGHAAYFGEPVRTLHDRPSLPRWLARRGLRSQRVCDADDLWSLYLEPLGAVFVPRAGELLVAGVIDPGASPARSGGPRNGRRRPAR